MYAGAPGANVSDARWSAGWSNASGSVSGYELKSARTLVCPVLGKTTLSPVSGLPISQFPPLLQLPLAIARPGINCGQNWPCGHSDQSGDQQREEAAPNCSRHPLGTRERSRPLSGPLLLN